MAKYTVEDFTIWLNADKKRKRGLWVWSQVIDKIKNDPDLFATLSTGIDQGGWNISDPKFRYLFEDYYQVFQEWKREVDAKEIKENQEEQNEKPEKEKQTPPKNKDTEKIIPPITETTEPKENSGSKMLTYGIGTVLVVIFTLGAIWLVRKTN